MHPVAMALANSAKAVLPSARVYAMMPLPTTAISKKPAPKNSANIKFFTVNLPCS